MQGAQCIAGGERSAAVHGAAREIARTAEDAAADRRLAGRIRSFSPWACIRRAPRGDRHCSTSATTSSRAAQRRAEYRRGPNLQPTPATAAPKQGFDCNPLEACLKPIARSDAEKDGCNRRRRRWSSVRFGSNAYGRLSFFSSDDQFQRAFDRPRDDPMMKVAVKNAAESNACSRRVGPHDERDGGDSWASRTISVVIHR